MPDETTIDIARTRGLSGRRRLDRDPLARRLARAGLWPVVVVTLAFYALWAGIYFVDGHEARDFIKIGYRFAFKGQSSDVIKVDPTYDYPPNRDSPSGFGYDGQWSYYIALDPVNAPDYLDLPSFRYTRVLYPMVVRATALGKPKVIPYTLLLVNWFAVGLGTLALAAWLRRRSWSPWWALVYGFYPGLLVCFQRDLTEPLAYALVACAVYLFDSGRRGALLGAALLFGLAGLSRQTTVAFGLCYAAAVLLAGTGDWRARLRANWLRAVGFLALAVGPLLAWMAFLWAWLGSPGASAPGNTSPPLVGLIASEHWQLSRQPPEIVGVVIPALILIALVLVAWRAGRVRVEMACVLANAIPFVLLLGPNVYRGYTSSGRAALGVALAGVLAAPGLAALGRNSRRALLTAAALALSMLPVVVVYGLVEPRVGRFAI
jgi:hypothetical protein